MPTINIAGMSCAHCTGSVTKLLSSIPGITDVSVTLTPGRATFEAAPEVDLEAVRKAIRNIGFDPQD